MEVISVWELYLWTRLDNLTVMLTVVVVGLGFSLFMSAVFITIDGVWEKYTNKYIAGCLIISVFMVGLVLTPTTKQAAMIYVIPKITNNEHIQNEASEIYTMAKDALKEYLPTEEESK